jgi:ribonucleotide monophosphatase NagD (HAD superfamily)
MLRRHLAESGENDTSGPLNVYMVGDNPESDIAGANAFGWNSILVKTGVYRNGEPAHVPTKIADDVEEGVKWAIERELRRF